MTILKTRSTIQVFLESKNSNKVILIDVNGVRGINEKAKNNTYCYNSDGVLSISESNQNKSFNVPENPFEEDGMIFIEVNCEFVGDEIPATNDDRKEWKYSLGTEGSPRHIDSVELRINNEDITKLLTEKQIESIQEKLFEL